MNEHDFILELKGMSEEIPVPDAFQPGNSSVFYIQAQKKKRKRMLRFTSAAAGCLAVVICFSLFFNTRIPVVENNTLSGYGDIYKTLQSIKGKDVKGISQLLSEKSIYAEGRVQESAASDFFADVESQRYSKTNIQVEGVDEGDVVKTDGSHVYILKGSGTVQIVRVNQGQLESISSIKLKVSEDGYSDGEAREMFLQKNTLVVLSEEHGPDNGRTRLDFYDISDKGNPALIQTLYQDGSYHSSRIADGYLYTISTKYIYDLKDEKNIESYVPAVGGEVIACPDIIIPSEPNSAVYTVVSAVSVKNSESFSDSKAFLGSTDNIYVSTENIYLSSSFYKNTKNGTEIIRLAYKNGSITKEAVGLVNGFLNNQFSMDEKDGMLRLVTTGSEASNDGLAVSRSFATKNNLYILDSSLSIVGKIEGLAEGESIYSARFLGNTAYFVTFRQVDPLFSVDLSDPSNPKVMGELKIPGFSSYLHPYEDGLLLGIGMDADENGSTSGVKVSMFDISDPYNVKEIDKYVFEEIYYSEALSNHKSVLISRAKNIIGFSGYGFVSSKTRSYQAQFASYLLLGYDRETGFFEKTNIQIGDSNSMPDLSGYRGLYIGDFFILAGNEHIASYDMNDNFTKVSSLDF